MASEGAVLSEGRTFVVMANGSTDFRTITEALKECSDGDTITVKIGQYDEKIVLEKNVTIQGDSESEVSDIIVNGGMVCKSSGTVRGLSITSQIEIRAGNVTIDSCEISEGFDGIRVSSGAHPTIVKNNIHHSRQGGDCIYLAEGSRALIEDNEIHSARVNGIHVNCAEATIRRNRIHDCHFGIFFRRRAKGTVESNHVQDCTTFGIYIVQNADPVVMRNSISGCQIHSILVSQDGMGNIRGNMCNGSFAIKKGALPQLDSNQVLGKFENENDAVQNTSLMG
ncbi:F-box protein dre-1 [Diplonema papillatum]|nr:F-box protein dre-1 [Diplonema papillatum]